MTLQSCWRGCRLFFAFPDCFSKLVFMFQPEMWQLKVFISDWEKIKTIKLSWLLCIFIMGIISAHEWLYKAVRSHNKSVEGSCCSDKERISTDWTWCTIAASSSQTAGSVSDPVPLQAARFLTAAVFQSLFTVVWPTYFVFQKHIELVLAAHSWFMWPDF